MSSVKERLKDADQRFMRSAAPVVGRAASRAADRRQTALTGLKDLRENGVDVRTLAALDDRYATRGLLGFFREVPQLLGVVIGIVLVAGGLGAAHLGDGSSSSEQSVGGPRVTLRQQTVPTSDVLGPAAGDRTATYIATASAQLVQAAGSAPDQLRYALVSLVSYQTPEQLSALLHDYTVRRVWVRDHAVGSDATQLAVQIDRAVLPELKAAYVRAVAAQRRAQTAYQEYANTTVDDPAYKSSFQHYADVSKDQVEAYGSNCACAFAVLVQATPRQLLALQTRVGIRSVEVAQKGVNPTNLQVQLLFPETKGVVPNPPTPVTPP